MRQFLIILLMFTPAALLGADKPELTESEAQQVIQKFAAKEAEFALAREVYTYRQSVKIQELGNGGQPGGKYEIISDIIFSANGKRTEKIVRAPANTLKEILLTPEDEQDLRSVQPFVLTTKDSASLPGMTDVTSASKITGSWAITAATQVDAKVKLTPRKASDAKLLKEIELQNFRVAFTGERTFVNETRWYRMRSSICKK